MKRTVCFLLVLLTVLTAGCSPEPEKTHTPSKSVGTAAPAKPATSVTAAAAAKTEEDTATSGATPTVPEGMCTACGTAPGDYDGYCYYCHPDFGFTCSKCGNFYPAHRTSSGLCPDCEALDATTGATPTVPDGMCKACGLDYGDYDGYCYYCHPDFGFTCSKCGNFHPAHRTSSGLCPNCENPA